jgi:hypothetical protein
MRVRGQDQHGEWLRRASPAYASALLAAREHHQRSKTYSGLFLRQHASPIKEIIDRLRIRSALDYGAGKGQQYAWRSHDAATGVPVGMGLEEFWGIPVTKYDPAWPPYSGEPAGQFGLVICTHTLGSIPTVDLPWVIDRIYGFASRAVYIAEKLGHVGKTVRPDPLLHPHFNRAQWLEALGDPYGREVTLSTRERLPDGQVVIERGLVHADWYAST